MKETAAAESDEVIIILWHLIRGWNFMCTSLKFTSKITAPHIHAEESGQERHSHWTQQKDSYLELRGTAYYHEKLANINIATYNYIATCWCLNPYSKSYNMARSS